MNRNIAGIDMPDTALARAALEHIRGVESELTLHHALRAFLFAALTGIREALEFDAELLYVGTLFHNVGLSLRYNRSPNRFEIDSANEAREFLIAHGVGKIAAEDVWNAVALHTTPGIPEHMSALVLLVSAGVQMDVRGARYYEFTAQQRDAIVQAFPRERGFKSKLIEAYARGMVHRPETTFGTVNADVLDRWDPDYRRLNFCGLVLGSEWPN
ncbi:HD domain-containing protein [Paraburkholderia phymatum]|uniref:Metal-dependent phosphohydrolase HD sub domain n=1 Tax=Paraburkholderia phymatum (strain DSM 17167 / CIP 108236 / LMG 21445 / STM815) TaxID=391038 RepID=B2JV02_PARP8|nr:HD domain-containing protein [Paraburkholderia phymatum]ACC74780.1 metal-dependent phosphohydrolase HD sub domain [Paraburkholderia phymatum STM815]